MDVILGSQHETKPQGGMTHGTCQLPEAAAVVHILEFLTNSKVNTPSLLGFLPGLYSRKGKYILSSN